MYRQRLKNATSIYFIIWLLVAELLVFVLIIPEIYILSQKIPIN